MSINFYNEQIDFLPDRTQALQKWVTSVIDHKGLIAGTINFIFCNDEYLLKLNQQYLDHDTYTDIITFDYSVNTVVSGDIFISIDRINENAEKYNKSFENELHRVIIHGILHLCGQKDKTDAESNEMRSQEDYYLNWY